MSLTTRLVGLVVAIASLALFAGCGPGSKNQRYSCGSYRFDYREWATIDWQVYPNGRQKQFDAIDRCGLLKGLTRVGVIEMLGTKGLVEGRSRRGRFMSYELGTWNALGDRESATIYLDGKARVKTIYHPTMPYFG